MQIVMVQKSSTLPKIVNSSPVTGGLSQFNVEPNYFHVDRNTNVLDSEHSDDDVDVHFQCTWPDLPNLAIHQKSRGCIPCFTWMWKHPVPS